MRRTSRGIRIGRSWPGTFPRGTDRRTKRLAGNSFEEVLAQPQQERLLRILIDSFGDVWIADERGLILATDAVMGSEFPRIIAATAPGPDTERK